MSVTHKIDVVCRAQDGGDGGFTIHFYNSEKEMLDNHPLGRKWEMVDGKMVNHTVALTEQQEKDILLEDDPYKTGYITKKTIELESIDGKLRLVKGLSIHFGQ